MVQMCGREGEVEEQPDLQDRKVWMWMGQRQRQSCSKTNVAPLGLSSHGGGFQQKF